MTGEGEEDLIGEEKAETEEEEGWTEVDEGWTEEVEVETEEGAEVEGVTIRS